MNQSNGDGDFACERFGDPALLVRVAILHGIRSPWSVRSEKARRGATSDALHTITTVLNVRTSLSVHQKYIHAARTRNANQQVVKTSACSR